MFRRCSQRGQIFQAVGLQFRRHVARFAAAIGHRFDQRALFAANVTAGTNEHEIWNEPTEQHRILAAKPELLGASNLRAAGVDLLGVFMADVDESLSRFGDQTRPG